MTTGSLRLLFAVGLFATVMCLSSCGGPDAKQPYGQARVTSAEACEGPRSHDFGRLLLEGGESNFAHTFQLTNMSERQLVVDDVRSTCGCTVPEVANRNIAPGEVLELAVTLRLSRAGVRTSQIRLFFDDGSYVPLTIRGEGYYDRAVFSTQRSVDLITANEAQALLVARNSAPALPPSRPIVVTQPGIDCFVDDWRPISADPSGKSLRFHCRLTFSLPDPNVRQDWSDDHIAVQVDHHPAIKVRITGRAW